MVAERTDAPQQISIETFQKVQQELQRANQKVRQLEQEIQRLKAEDWQRRELRKKKEFKPAEKDYIIELERLIESPHTHKDEEGFTRICHTTIAKNTGTSESTAKRKSEAIPEQWPNWPVEMKTVTEHEDGKVMDRLYIKKKFDTSLIQAAIDAELSEEKKRKQGGNKYICQQCGSADVKIKRRLHCNCCGHETDLEDIYPNGELKNKKSRSNLLSENDITDGPYDESDTGETGRSNLLSSDNETDGNFFDEGVQLDGVVLKPVPPPISMQLADDSEEDDTPKVDPIITRTRAAALSVAIAGNYPIHIGMNRRGENKYRTAKGCLTLEMGIEHFQGKETYGALCSRSDGLTRALCKDSDSAAEWELIKGYARTLEAAGYLVILESSPAGRGGHMWIIFDALVIAAAAWSAVYALVPELANIKESWPATEHGKGNRVRLPGGKYLRPGIEQWCELLSMRDGNISTNGDESAQLLLANQTPASIIPSADPDPTNDQAEQTQTEQTIDDQADELRVEQEPIGFTGIDEEWRRKYDTPEGRKLWFTFVPSYLVARFNEEHTPEDYLPKQSNKKAFSPNGPERTPSTDFYVDKKGRELFSDFSKNGMRPDGSPDTGDAFEAYLRTSGKSKDLGFSELAKAMNAKAKQELESAARQGQPIPGWIEEIISPAGRDYYARIRPRLAGDPEQTEQQESTGGGTGFQNVPATELFPTEQKPVYYPPCMVCLEAKDTKRADGVMVCRNGCIG